MHLTEAYRIDEYPFGPGDQLLLYTDGVTETRDRTGAFYPLHRRVLSWGPLQPRELLDRLHHDLLVYSNNHLHDDTAALAIYHLPE